MEIRDKDGLTEAEFLAQYSPKDYPRPSLTVDIVLFAPAPEGGDERLLLIQRGGHPFLSCWALPGGFVGPSEDAHMAAARELFEETSVSGIACEQLGVYSRPGRDPRGWTVSAAFISRLNEEVAAHEGDDAASAAWCAIRIAERAAGIYDMEIDALGKTLTCTFKKLPAHIMPARAHVLASEGLAFDHAQIIADAWLATHE